MRHARSARGRLSVGLLLALVAATAGCSLLIGVSGDPIVVDDAATADEPDGQGLDAGDGAPE